MKIYTNPAISTKKLTKWLEKVKNDEYRTDDERRSAIHLLKMVGIDIQLFKRFYKTEEQKEKSAASLKALLGEK